MSSSHPSLRGAFSTPAESLNEQCDTIITLFENSDDIVQAGRNTLKKIRFNNLDCVIKAFRKPSFPQNYSYGFFSKSKANKSYDNATKLIELGFLSPKPIGYFEYRRGGKLTSSYYLCEFEAIAQTLHSILEDQGTLSTTLIQQFAEYSLALHKKGILHRDFNPKNILVTQKNEFYTFSLVDINRITWYEQLSLELSMHSLARLPFDDLTKDSLLTHYANIAEVELDHCHKLLNKSKAQTKRYFKNKKRLRKIFPKRKK